MSTRSSDFHNDIQLQITFEREARASGLPFTSQVINRPRRRVYTVPITVPVYDEQRILTIIPPRLFLAGESPQVTIDGPACQRHRYHNGAVCMWWPSDPDDARWNPIDGLLALVDHAIEHAFCEAECRRGLPWPKPEAPTRHVQSCSSCAPPA